MVEEKKRGGKRKGKQNKSGGRTGITKGHMVILHIDSVEREKEKETRDSFRAVGERKRRRRPYTPGIQREREKKQQLMKDKREARSILIPGYPLLELREEKRRIVGRGWMRGPEIDLTRRKGKGGKIGQAALWILA